MGRVRNEEEFEKKKKEIIFATIGIIMEKGYDIFSLNYLLKAISMSKGVFFHYFTSKDDLVKQVVEFSSIELITSIENLAKDDSLSSIDKIRKLYHQSSEQMYPYGSEGEQLAKMVYTENNKAFIDLVSKAAEAPFHDYLIKVIMDGNKSGDFNVKCVHGTVNQIMNLTLGTNNLLSDFVLSDQKEKNIDNILETIEVLENTITFLLGSEPIGNLYLNFI